MLRLFVAISLDPGPMLLEAMQDFRRRLSSSSINWVAAQGLHITLRFLGETQADKRNSIVQALENIRPKGSPDILVKGAGCFGPRSSPRVIWLGVEPENFLKRLAADINFALREPGFALPERAFSAHLTLGRIKRLDKPEVLQDCIGYYRGKELHRQPFKGFGLYSSLLRPDGPVYTLEKHFPISHDR